MKFAFQIFRRLEKIEFEWENAQIFCQWSQMSPTKLPLTFFKMKKFLDVDLKLNKSAGLIFEKPKF